MAHAKNRHTNLRTKPRPTRNAQHNKRSKPNDPNATRPNHTAKFKTSSRISISNNQARRFGLAPPPKLAAASAAAISAVSTAERHVGHVPFRFTQLSKHEEWNTWLQLSSVASSPGLTSSPQTVHSFTGSFRFRFLDRPRTHEIRDNILFCLFVVLI